MSAKPARIPFILFHFFVLEILASKAECTSLLSSLQEDFAHEREKGSEAKEASSC